MRHSITAAIIAIFGFVGAAQASQPISTGHPACDAALDGYHAAADVIIQTSEKPAGYTLTEHDVSLFYQAVEYRNACHEVMLATCGCGIGFSCPPASTTARQRCEDGWLLTRETSSGGREEINVARYHSQVIQSGVHFVEFNVPIDIFKPERTSITITIKTNAEPPTIPALNNAGDVLYIRDNSLNIGGKYKCRPTWYDSIEQANLSADDVWNKRTGSGAKQGDVVNLGDFANCEAFANQAFIVEVKEVPENAPELIPTTPPEDPTEPNEDLKN